MTDNLLYFPYINVPKTNWTTISVLYWDNVGAIVPDIYKDHPNRLENNMLELVEAELIQQIFPYHYTYDIPNFDQAFLDLTDTAEFDLTARQNDFAQGRGSRVHIQKFSENLLRELERRRIIRRENHEWYYVEHQTARIFMTYLATVISKVEGFTPATDNTRNIDLRPDRNAFPYHRLSTRNRFLNELIPYPLAASAYQLKTFKEEYYDQLKNFRNRLEQTIIEIVNIQGKEAREIYYQLKLREILERRDEIFARLGESRLGQITFGTLFGLTAAGIGFDAGHPLLGSFALGNAIYSAFQGYDRQELLNGDISYLALIDKKFGGGR